MSPEPQEERPRRGFSSWSPGTKALVIVAVVAASIVGLSMVLAIAGGIYLYAPSGQSPSAAVLTPETRGYLRIHADVDDEGIGALLFAVGEEIGEAQRRQQEATLPRPLRFLARMQSRNAAGILESVWPRDATVAFEEGLGSDRSVAIVNLRRYGGLVPVLFELVGKNESERHGGRAIIESSFGWIGAVGGSLAVASVREDLEELMDRLDRQAPMTRNERLATFASPLESGYDAHFAQLGLPAFLEPETPELEPVLRSVEAIGVGLDLKTADRLEGVLVVDLRDEALLPAFRTYLSEMETRIVEELGSDELELSFRDEPRTGGITHRFVVSGIEANLRRALRESIRASR